MGYYERTTQYYEGVGYRNFINSKKINETKLAELWNKENNSNLKNPFNIVRKKGWEVFHKFVNKHKSELCGNNFSFSQEDDERIMRREDYQIAKNTNPAMMQFLKKLKKREQEIPLSTLLRAFKNILNCSINENGFSVPKKLENCLAVFNQAEHEEKIIQYLKEQGYE